MKLILIRHGDALPWSERGDAGRALSPAGIQEVISVRGQISEWLDDCAQVLHSPYLRACQTAELLIEGRSPALAQSDALLPESSPRLACAAIEAYEGQETLLVVTHQPLIGSLVNWLCQGHAGQLAWGTAQVALIEADWPAADLGRLLGCHSPR